MRNIGPVTQQWLAEIDIYTLKDLKQAGSVLTYQMLKEKYPKKVSLNLLWGVEAAIRDMDWRELTAEDKAALKSQLK